MEDHRARCRMLVRQMSRQSGFNFIVATDGSAGAHLAFLGAMALRKGEGCVQMLHIADPSVETKDLKPERQPENIRQRYEIELVPKISKERYKWTLLWKPDKYDIKQTIVAATNQMEQHIVDQFDYGAFFVCGWVQEDSSKEGAPPSVLGSSTDLCLRQMSMPVVIMKRPLAPKERTFEQPSAPHVFIMLPAKTSRSRTGAQSKSARPAHGAKACSRSSTYGVSSRCSGHSRSA